MAKENRWQLGKRGFDAMWSAVGSPSQNVRLLSDQHLRAIYEYAATQAVLGKKGRKITDALTKEMARRQLVTSVTRRFVD